MTVLTLGAGWACGPSVQSIYEGNVRFEHCYRLDLDREVAPSHRAACWQEWTETYAYGQTRDKTEYALRRLRYLAAGETSPPTLELERPAAGQRPEAASPSLNVHAPPPQLATPSDGAPLPPSGSLTSPEPPRTTCVEGCRSTYTGCLGACAGTTSATSRNCLDCERDYDHCARRCFE